jgi:hypothetical protein
VDFIQFGAAARGIPPNTTSRPFIGNSATLHQGRAGHIVAALKLHRPTAHPALSVTRGRAFPTERCDLLPVVFEIHEGNSKGSRQCRKSRTIAFVVAPEKNVLKVGHVNRVLKVRSGVAEEFVNKREVRGNLFEIASVDGYTCRPSENGHFQVKQSPLNFVDLIRDCREAIGE